MEQNKKELGLIGKIGCLIWPIGLLVFFLMKKSQPKISKQALNLALIGFGISLVLSIISSIVLP